MICKGLTIIANKTKQITKTYIINPEHSLTFPSSILNTIFTYKSQVALPHIYIDTWNERMKRRIITWGLHSGDNCWWWWWWDDTGTETVIVEQGEPQTSKIICNNNLHKKRSQLFQVIFFPISAVHCDCAALYILYANQICFDKYWIATVWFQ